jgi:hypothetical protein
LRIDFEMGSFPVVIKDALEIMGIAAGPARPHHEARRREKEEADGDCSGTAVIHFRIAGLGR